jgi:hypothetical protein
LAHAGYEVAAEGGVVAALRPMEIRVSVVGRVCYNPKKSPTPLITPFAASSTPLTTPPATSPTADHVAPGEFANRFTNATENVLSRLILRR